MVAFRRVRADRVGSPARDRVEARRVVVLPGARGRGHREQGRHVEELATREVHERIIDPMNLDPTWLFVSLIPTGIGFVLFVYGKKQERWFLMLAGIVFSVYPYFTSSILAMVGVGVALGAGLWMAVRAGW